MRRVAIVTKSIQLAGDRFLLRYWVWNRFTVRGEQILTRYCFGVDYWDICIDARVRDSGSDALMWNNRFGGSDEYFCIGSDSLSWLLFEHAFMLSKSYLPVLCRYVRDIAGYRVGVAFWAVQIAPLIRIETLRLSLEIPFLQTPVSLVFVTCHLGSRRIRSHIILCPRIFYHVL